MSPCRADLDGENETAYEGFHTVLFSQSCAPAAGILEPKSLSLCPREGSVLLATVIGWGQLGKSVPSMNTAVGPRGQQVGAGECARISRRSERHMFIASVPLYDFYLATKVVIKKTKTKKTGVHPQTCGSSAFLAEQSGSLMVLCHLTPPTFPPPYI